MDYILGDNRTPNKFQRIQFIQIISHDHNRIKLKIGNRKIFTKFPQIRKLSKTFLNKPLVKEKIKREWSYLNIAKHHKDWAIRASQSVR